MKKIMKVKNNENQDKYDVEYSYTGGDYYIKGAIEQVIGTFNNKINISSEEIFKGKTPAKNIVINTGAFSKIKGMKKLTIPNGIETIPEECFSGSTIEKLELPPSINTIGARAFERMNIGKLVIPKDITEIPKECLSGSTIGEVILPPSINTIGIGAFEEMNIIGKLVIPEGVTKIPDRCFYRSTIGELELPPSIDTIGAGAFERMNIGKLVLPKNITKIPEEWFSGSTIEELVLPPSIITHGTGVIRVKNIDKLVILGDIEEIPEQFFCGSTIGELILPPSIDTIGASAFEEINIGKFVIPKDVTEIPDDCFYGSTIGELELPPSIDTIGAGAFERMNIEKLVIPKDVTEIGSTCFSKSKINSLFIKNSELRFFIKKPELRFLNTLDDIYLLYSNETFKDLRAFNKFSGKVYFFSKDSDKFFKKFKTELTDKKFKVEDLENNFKDLAKNDFQTLFGKVKELLPQYFSNNDQDLAAKNAFLCKFDMLTFYLFSKMNNENKEQKTIDNIEQELKNIQNYCNKHAPMTLKLISQGLMEDQMVNLSSTKLKSSNKGVENYENAEDLFKLCKDMTISDLIEIHKQTPIPPLEKYLKGSIEEVKERASFPLEQLTLKDIVQSNKVSFFEQNANETNQKIIDDKDNIPKK